MPSTPTRLALQTGELDDHRRDIGPGDHLWDRAHRCYTAHDLEDMRVLCRLWPSRDGSGNLIEACAVTVALAAPFASRERVLIALTAHGFTLDELAGAGEPPPVLAESPDASRPHCPRVYDPDADERAPIVAVLDGPRSAKVALLLDAIKRQDPPLAEAIVLGADLETLELLDRLSSDAKRAARGELAAQVDHDRAHWRHRADQVRARQRLEGARYGWHGDNFPPGCLEAARAEQRHAVEDLLEHPPAAPG